MLFCDVFGLLPSHPVNRLALTEVTIPLVEFTAHVGYAGDPDILRQLPFHLRGDLQIIYLSLRGFVLYDTLRTGRHESTTNEIFIR